MRKLATTGPDYIQAERELWQANIQEVHKKPLSRRAAVIKDAERLGISPEILWYEFLTNPTLAATYAKDPTKQSIHQKVAMEWITALPLVTRFQQLEASGGNALYLSSGQVFLAEKCVNDDKTKSIDFTWQLEVEVGNPITFFATHKFTKVAGGNQDNQFKDVISFAAHAKKLEVDNRNRLLMLCDGPYYQSPQGAHRSKIEYLNSVHTGRFSQAMSTAELPQYLCKLIFKELERTDELTEEIAKALDFLEAFRPKSD